MIRRGLAAALLLGLATNLAAQNKTPSADQIEFFESRIRPVLIEQCYACHNSADNAESGLAMDSRDALLAGSDGGAIIVPGDPGSSRLIAVLKHDVEGLEMPEGGARLEDEVIADFAKWIEMGAPDPRDQPPSATEIAELTSWESTLQRRKQWWSFRPIQDVTPPEGRAAHPVDRFIDAQLQPLGLSRSPRADSATLIRRLFVTLIGLPPSPEQSTRWVKRFEQSKDQAIDELIDELLRSPHFGERWARHWMDWIRYAESHGSEGDPRIEGAWRYRDYLIRALNEDVSYDQLVREHVAGDLLASPRVNESIGINESAIGTAHWRMVFHGFAPTDALDEKVRFVDDQINAFTKAFLGLTVSCARCHDHKFDAISQADYYALFGILGSCRPAREVIDLPDDLHRNRQELMELKPQIRSAIAHDWRSSGLNALRERLASGEFNAEQKKDSLIALLERARQNGVASVWEETKKAENPASEPKASGQHWKFSRRADTESWYRHGIGLDDQPAGAGEFAIAVDGDRALAGIYPAGVYSHSISSKSPARFTSPDYVLQPDQKLWVRAIGDGNAALRYAVQDYPRSGTVFPVRTLNPQWSWQQFDVAYWSGDSMHVELATARDAPLLVKDNDRSWFGVTEVMITSNDATPAERDAALHAVVSSKSQPNSYESLVDIYVDEITRAVESWQNDSITDDQAHLLDRCLKLSWLPNSVGQLAEAAPLLRRYRELEAEIPVPTRVPGLDETVGRQQPLYIRGNHKKPGEVIPRRFLDAIDPEPYRTEQSGRLELAKDLLRRDNPLTRRVIVNRLWHHLFGRGIVETPDNFGRLGAEPTHPQLLDWLANQMLHHDGSIKEMIRLMVSSQTWQQSSRPTQQAQRVDPSNGFLSHANIRRMEAEAIRDSLLLVSGRLDAQSLFGPPVDGNSNRRSVYMRVIRNDLDPFLRAFDFPEPYSSVGRRDATNVPAQSLMMLNDRRVREVAVELANRIVRDDSLGSERERLTEMFLTTFSRMPTDDEVELYTGYVSELSTHFAERQTQAREVRQELDRQRELVRSILDPARQKLSEDPSNSSANPPPPDPIALWTFDENLQDSIGELHGTSHGKAHVTDGALVVRSGGYVSTAPLKKPLTAKTIEAWVQLDNLQQRGGGVITVQTQNGVVFDAIVFGEQKPQHWLAGSNNFRRTQPFSGPAEIEANERSVHVAIVYHQDGTISGYRDGQPYGKSYSSDGPHRFKPNETILSFGVRHLPAGGNRLLSGQIDQARLYDRALTAQEVAASFAAASGLVTRQQVVESLNEAQRQQLASAEQQIERFENELEAIGAIPGGSPEMAAWIDIAHASLMMKEFIYVQ